MIGVRVGVDHRVETQPEVGEHGQVAVELLLQRIDQRRAVRLVAGDQIGFALAAVELAKQHASLLARPTNPVGIAIAVRAPYST